MWILLSALFACDPAAPPAPPAPVASAPAQPTALTEVKSASIADLAAAKQAGPVQLVDVRSVEEFAAGHVAGAINLPLDQFSLLDPRLGSLDKSKPVYAICASGARSAHASKEFASGGWQIYNVAGGTKAWIAAGHPVE